MCQRRFALGLPLCQTVLPESGGEAGARGRIPSRGGRKHGQGTRGGGTLSFERSHLELDQPEDEAPEGTSPGTGLSFGLTVPASGFSRKPSKQSSADREEKKLGVAAKASITSFFSVTSTEKEASKHILEIQSVLKEELSRCLSAKDVQKLLSTANRVIGAPCADSLGVSGRVAYRLREVLRCLRNSNFAAVECHHLLLIQKALSLEVARRRAELEGAPVHDLALEAQMRLPQLLAPLSQDGEKRRLHPRAPAGPPPPQPRYRRALGRKVSDCVLARDSRGSLIPLLPPAGQKAVSWAKGPRVEGPPQLEQLLTPRESSLSPKGLQLWRSAFSKFEDEGRVHHDSLADAVGFAGLNLDRKMLQKCVKDVSNGYDTLPMDDFLHLLSVYQERMNEKLDKAFSRVQGGQRGPISLDQLKELLAEAKMNPMEHILQDVLSETAPGSPDTVTLEDFRFVLAALHEHEGFTKGELRVLQTLFSRCDRVGAGEIEVADLPDVLDWLGFPEGQCDTNSLLDHMNVDRKGNLGFREFLMFMRKVRESELDMIKQLAGSADAPGTAWSISFAKLQEVFPELGYELPDPEAIVSAASEAGLPHEPGDVLSRSAVCWLLSRYRAREGFTTAELEEMLAVVKRYCEDGYVSQRGVHSALRDLGYAVTYDEIRLLAAKVDLDQSGKVSASDVLKILRMHNSAMVRKVIAEKMRKDSEHDQQRQTEEGREASGIWEAVVQIRRSNDAAFLNTISKQLRERRDSVRANGGYEDPEIAELKRKFEKYDLDKSGDIRRHELARLLQECFPDISTNIQQRATVQRVVLEMERRNHGRFDFNQFLELMGHVTELQQEERLEREKKTVETAGFSHKEVEEFRELFLANSGGHAALPLRAVIELVTSITPLGDRSMSQLMGHVAEVCLCKEKAESVEFPEFILLMRKLIHVNFAGIAGVKA